MNSELPHKSPPPPVLALGNYLKTLAQEHALKAITLSNDDGLLLAGHQQSADFDLDELAALAPLMEVSPGVRDAMRQGLAPHDELAAVSMEVSEQSVFLTTVGGSLADVDEPRQAFSRILNLLH